MKMQVLIEIDVLEGDEDGIKTIRDFGIDYKDHVLAMGRPDDNYLEVAINSYPSYLKFSEAVGILNKHIGTIDINKKDKEIRWSENVRDF